jgi:hypothetical protein
VLAEGMLTYNLDTKALEVYDGTAWGPVVTVKEKRIEAFTGSGTWTVPAGVTYAIAHMLGGGGGGGAQNADGASGGDSTVAFASGTVSGPGGRGGASTGSATAKLGPVSIANSGAGGLPSRADTTNGNLPVSGGNSVWVVAAAAVTPAASITVTVGAGGSGNTGGLPGRDGGSGYVYIEYYEEV